MSVWMGSKSCISRTLCGHATTQAAQPQQISVATTSPYRCFQCFRSLFSIGGGIVSGYSKDVDAGILPVKNLTRAKRRLAEHFEDADRQELARALLDDALNLCRDSGFLTWFVASDDEEALERAQSYGFHTVKDQTGTLNGALQQAVQVAIAEGATSVTMVPSDIPLAYSGDLRDLLDTGSTSEVVVVPSARDGGTNGLYLRPPDILEPRFGTASMQAHLLLAERLGFRCSILVLPRLALDIDTLDDINDFLRNERASETQTAQLLARMRPELTGAES